jgi:hypothetical protein
LTYEILDILIKIFTIIGSLAGFLALYFSYKEFKRKKPIIECYVEQSSFNIIKQEHEGKERLSINAKFVINNTGAIDTSITGCIGYVRYHRDAAKHLSEKVIDALPNEDIFPIHIKADNSTKFNLSFSFKVYPEVYYLERCYMPLDLQNPKKWQWKDLPLLTRFVFKHTKGKFETMKWYLFSFRRGTIHV